MVVILVIFIKKQRKRKVKSKFKWLSKRKMFRLRLANIKAEKEGLRQLVELSITELPDLILKPHSPVEAHAKDPSVPDSKA